ncbi:MAG: HAD family phosphatase [Candidatus Lokiarchaeota archaeon]|jgi:putative hydrolase of the HAD superfamily|nr:HAD family phosphatase [Candidatus Lokiarchaeota archaeon]
MIKNIIFDLGNVLLRFQPSEFLLRFTGDIGYIEQFIPKIFRSTVWLDLDRGTISLENAKDNFISKYPKEKDFLTLFFNHWMEMLTPIEENIKILKELRNLGYKTYILSNFIKETFTYIENNYDIFSFFDGQIISGFEKTIKPEKEIYMRLLNQYRLIPEECLFIDDVLFFLKPAKKLGMKIIWNQPKTDLREELRKFDIPI